MFITPMTSIQSLEELRKPSAVSEQHGSDGAFRDIFGTAINNVVTTQQDLAEKQYLLSTGQIDDAHTVPIATTQAQLSIDLLVQLRNKALESYNELIRLSV